LCGDTRRVSMSKNLSDIPTEAILSELQRRSRHSTAPKPKQLKDLSKEIAEAIVDQLDAIDERQREQRARWYTKDDNGVLVESRDNYEVAGTELDLPVIGVERPTRMDLDEVKVVADSDTTVDADGNIIVRMNANSDKTSNVAIEVKMKKGEVSEGLLALHKRAVNEIKERLMHIPIPVNQKKEGDTNEKETE